MPDPHETRTDRIEGSAGIALPNRVLSAEKNSAAMKTSDTTTIRMAWCLTGTPASEIAPSISGGVCAPCGEEVKAHSQQCEMHRDRNDQQDEDRGVRDRCVQTRRYNSGPSTVTSNTAAASMTNIGALKAMAADANMQATAGTISPRAAPASAPRTPIEPAFIENWRNALATARTVRFKKAPCYPASGIQNRTGWPGVDG